MPSCFFWTYLFDDPGALSSYLTTHGSLTNFVFLFDDLVTWSSTLIKRQVGTRTCSEAPVPEPYRKSNFNRTQTSPRADWEPLPGQRVLLDSSRFLLDL